MGIKEKIEAEAKALAEKAKGVFHHKEEGLSKPKDAVETGVSKVTTAAEKTKDDAAQAAAKAKDAVSSAAKGHTS